MAKASNNIAVFVNVALMVSLVIAINMAEGKLLGSADTRIKPRLSWAISAPELARLRAFLESGYISRAFGFTKSSTPNCDAVHGVQSGETCFAVEQQFNLTAEEFGGINPNLDCDKLFAGQWLCVDGTA